MVSVSEYVERFNDLLIKEVSDRLTGSHKSYSNYYGDWPSDLFAAGNLRPVPQRTESCDAIDESDRESDSSDVPQYMRSSYTPSSMGLAIYAGEPTSQSILKVEGSFAIFDLICPDREDLIKSFNERYGNDIPSEATITFPKRFHRKRLRFYAEVALSELHFGQFIQIPGKDIEIESDEDSEFGLLLRKSGEPIREIKYEAITSEGAFAEFVEKSNNGSTPKRELEIQIRKKDFGNYQRIDVFLINRTVSPEERWLWSFDPFFFDTEMRVTLQGIELTRVPIPEISETDYRYSTEVVATGRNCHAKVIPGTKTIMTETLPIYDQPKIRWPKRVDESTFNYLALGSGDPRPQLKLLADSLSQYLSEWDDRSRLSTGERAVTGNEIVRQQSDSSRKDLEKEIQRYELGIKSLDDDRIRMSFQLMNLAFHERFRLTDKKNSQWRPFQLVFIVSLLPDILAREKPDFDVYANSMPATVLWLPTGAGKTEAFTAVVLVQAFFDRIRGKDSGVSAVLKFPLRFLSMQQLERAVMSIVAANRILASRASAVRELRAKYAIGERGFDQFSVGFYVGESATPNSPNAPRDGGPSPIDVILAGARGSEDFRFIATCPHCRMDGKGDGRVVLTANKEMGRIYHICEVCKREIPLLLTDAEIYAWLPTIIVSTIDKWAALGRKFESQMLFGIVRRRCPVHGYSFREDRCIDASSCTKSIAIPGIYDGPPSLIIQDELHMLDESLGALSSQFETFLRSMACSVQKIDGMSSKGEWKIIASSATIAGYERHVTSLYLKNAAVFPVKGPSSSDSFYYEYDFEGSQRRIVGFVPHNMTHPNAVIKTLQYAHGFIKPFENAPGLLAKTFPNEFGGISQEMEKELISNVRTSLMYGIVKSETYQILHSIEDQIDPYLLSIGLPEGIHITADVTGDTGPRDNIELLRRLQSPNLLERPEFIVATSSISHGVDLAQLNLMVFRGQPRSTAEFIQALSRVGRSHQGVIFTVYNPNRERDAAHYMLHNEFLEIGNVLIAPPSVDRFSRHAIEKTAGSVILGCSMLGRGNKSIVMSKSFLEHVGASAIRSQTEESFARCYIPLDALPAIPNRDVLESDIRNVFDRTIRTAVNEFARSGQPKYTSALLRCLSSLRQTDVEVELIVEDGSLRDEINQLRKPPKEDDQ
jgi:hypothetical protein